MVTDIFFYYFQDKSQRVLAVFCCSLFLNFKSEQKNHQLPFYTKGDPPYREETSLHFHIKTLQSGGYRCWVCPLQSSTHTHTHTRAFGFIRSLQLHFITHTHTHTHTGLDWLLRTLFPLLSQSVWSARALCHRSLPKLNSTVISTQNTHADLISIHHQSPGLFTFSMTFFHTNEMCRKMFSFS